MAQGGEQEINSLSDDSTPEMQGNGTFAFTEASRELLSSRIVAANYEYKDKTTALEETLPTLQENETNKKNYNEMRTEYKRLEKTKSYYYNATRIV